ncbi:hypothetical protein QBC46DRAFT_380725 [Diplogelasinospora grovesii]|uniref:Uncharacterized protein n=1 Tax=Diplogelasinospora grovesii TaxID=303347 RepID=A0AAN6S6D2_9PEZI|nr:hypothetical protein QBC46DRAFT_380725 [Diplogelasinospora grovesii]
MLCEPIIHDNVAYGLHLEHLHGAQAAVEPRSRRPIAEEARIALRGLRRSVQKWAMAVIVSPYDSTRLRNIDAQIDSMPTLAVEEREYLRQWMRAFGRKDRRRPRDRLLRDRNTRGIVMEIRKRTAFMGYTWRRMRPPSLNEVFNVRGEMHSHNLGREEDFREEAIGKAQDCWDADGYGGFGEWGDDVVALRAMHRGRFSMR